MAPRASSRPAAPRPVTAERAALLVKLLRLLGEGPRSRAALTRLLRRDVRSFYRDLVLLRERGISLPTRDGLYTLTEDVESAIARLPLPDPNLTLGEARMLAKGRGAAHKKLQAQLDKIVKG